MKRLISTLAALAIASPVFASSLTFDTSFAFEGELFQDTVGGGTPVSDGAPFGFSGAFSGLAPGDRVTLNLTIEHDSGAPWASTCSFAGLDCTREFVFLSEDKMTVQLMGTASASSFAFDLKRGRAQYFEEGGQVTDAGAYDLYSAEFNNAITLVTAPLPASGLLLVGAGLAFAALRRSRSR